MTMKEQQGSCTCGAVRYRVRGEPTRVGVCHCTQCRHETGSVLMAFAVYPSEQFEYEGRYASVREPPFLPELWLPPIQLRTGCARDGDQARHARLQYELWTKRREHWL